MVMDYVPEGILMFVQSGIGILVFVLILKFIKKSIAGFMLFMVVGFCMLVLTAAIPYMPTGPPDYFVITESDMDYITDMQTNGYFDYEFGVELFFGE